MRIFNVELSKDFDSIELYGLSDVHFEDKNSCRKTLYKFRDEVLEKENRFVIINGDIINTATKDSVSDIFSETLGIRDAVQRIADFLEPIKDRILVMIDGNHEKRVYKNTGLYLMEQVADKLGISSKFSEGAYLLYISFGKNNNRDNRTTVYSVYGKHGAGGGRLVGSKANSVLRMAESIDADIYIHSHTHLPLVFKNCFFRCNYRDRKVMEVTHTFVNTSSFLNFGGYGEELNFSPASKQYPKIILNGVKRDVKVVL